MQIKRTTNNGQLIAVIEDTKPVMTDVQSALDLIMTARYETGADRMLLGKHLITEDFFILRTCLAGEILQKVVNYQMKLAIYGDFSRYTSKPLRDFIYESNQGNTVCFAPDAQEAADRLGRMQ